MNDKEPTTAKSWREAIRAAIDHARAYAKAVTEDYLDDYRATTDDKKPEALRRTAEALLHAHDWYATANAIEKALNDNPDDDAEAAEAIKDRIKRDGQTDQADWCNPIADDLREATKRATDDGSRNAAQAAEHLAQAWAEAERWG